jgi:hypothetical protein
MIFIIIRIIYIFRIVILSKSEKFLLFFFFFFLFWFALLAVVFFWDSFVLVDHIIKIKFVVFENNVFARCFKFC